MNVIERLKKYMEDQNLKPHDISVLLNAHLGTVNRWLKTDRISEAWERILNDWLTAKGK